MSTKLGGRVWVGAGGIYSTRLDDLISGATRPYIYACIGPIVRVRAVEGGRWQTYAVTVAPRSLVRYLEKEERALLRRIAKGVA